MKKITIAMIAILLVGCLGIVGTGAMLTKTNEETFPAAGYVLTSDGEGVQQLRFNENTAYKSSKPGYVTFSQSEGGKTQVGKTSFVHLDDGSMMCLSDGVLMNYDDMSDNFINNYYITSGLVVSRTGDGYSAESGSGTINFGDYMWKSSEDECVVVSPTLKVHFSDSDVRTVNDFVEVHMTPDGICSVYTDENRWNTISDDFYIETASGVKYYPMSRIMDNGNYKMSAAKLSVSPDDSIVLTESETRRQIVPEFHIDAQDGADGAAGTTGAQGTAGSAGASGSDGGTGANGGAGNGGGTGETGKTGATGGGGKEGTAAGSSSSTNTALPVFNIVGWDVSSVGLKGKISIVDESEMLDVDVSDSDKTYPGILTLTDTDTGDVIYCYQISQEEYEGTKNISGDVSYEFKDLSESTEIYFSTIGDPLRPDTSYRLSFNAYYKVQGINGNESSTLYSREFIARNFYTDSTGLYMDKVKATTNTLTAKVTIPDAYRSTVTSARVYLLTSEQNKTFSINSPTQPGFEAPYFTLDYTNGTISKNEIGIDGTLSGVTEITFDNVKPDTTYYIRAIVGTNQAGAGSESLTKQTLELKTLKRAPTWNHNDLPEVHYNRITGCYEVYRQNVSDADGGILNYRITAYEGTNAVATKTISAKDSATVAFSLPTKRQTKDPNGNSLVENLKYTFGIEALFNDNEKDLLFDLGSSAQVEEVGNALPSVVINVDMYNYHAMKGSISINCSEGVGLKIADSETGTNPVVLQITANELQDMTVELKSAGTDYHNKDYDPQQNVIEGTDSEGNDIVGNVTRRCTASMSTNGMNTNISLDMENLKNNTTYTISIYTTIDLQDGNGEIYRCIGTANFHTKNIPAGRAYWNQNEDSGSAIQKNLRIVVDEDSAASLSYSQAEEDDMIARLQKGSVTLTFSERTGSSSLTQLSTVRLVGTQLQEVYSGDGLKLDEALFGGLALSSKDGKEYTIQIAEVVDETGSMVNAWGYANYVSNVIRNSTSVEVTPVPPALTASPDTQVQATPILRSELRNYVDADTIERDNYLADLSDDAIVGYLLQSKYDNSNYLAYSITYYALELKSFVNTLALEQNPLESSACTKLMTVTQRAVEDGVEMPKVALLFGTPNSTPTTSDNVTEPNGPKYSNNTYVYWTPKADGNANALTQGMGRGYLYVFANTIQYADKAGSWDNLHTYPNHMGSYEGFAKDYGCGLPDPNKWNDAKETFCYILNSGIVEAPRVDPKLHSYLYSLTDLNDVGGKTTGKLTFKYMYEDLDETIDQTSAAGQQTQLEYGVPNRINSVDINSDQQGADWHTIEDYEFEITQDTQFTAKLVIDRYALNYTTTILDQLSGNYASETGAGEEVFMYAARIPLEPYYGQRWALKTGETQMGISMVVEEEDNYVKFTLQPSQDLRNVARSMASRAYALKLTFHAENGVTVGPLYLKLNVPGSAAQFPYAELASGNLAAIRNQNFTYEASVLFDDGDQGWDLTGTENTSRMYALQYINGTGADEDTFEFSTYAGGGKSAGELRVESSGAKVTPAVLEDALAKDRVSSAMNKAILDMRNIMVDNTGGSLNKYLYISDLGVDCSGSKSTLDGHYIVPKGTGEYVLDTSNQTGKIDRIIPTIKMTPSASVSAVMGTNIVVNGWELMNVNPTDLYVYVYKDGEGAEESALSLGSQYLNRTRTKFILRDGLLDSFTLNINRDSDKVQNKENEKFHIVMVMVIDGKETVLMKNGTEKALYTVTTPDSIEVTRTSMSVNINSYYDKTIDMRIKLSAHTGMQLRYDIYTDEDTANAVESAAEETEEEYQPLMANNEVIRLLEGIPVWEDGVEDTRTLARNEYDMVMNLQPAVDRAKLYPGTYYLRIEAKVGGKVQGFGVFPFTISNAAASAMVIPQNVTSESIDFVVSLSDAGKQLMSILGDTDQNARYAVRFTDVNEKQIKTTYDNQLFSAKQRMTFTLAGARTVNGDSVPGTIIGSGKLEPGQTYKMYVYAVKDANGDGLNDARAEYAAGEVATAKQLLDTEVDDPRNPGQKILLLHKLINDQWDMTNGTRKSFSPFSISKSEQTTVSESGILIDQSQYGFTWVGATQIKLVMQRSYGVVAGDGTQAFKQVEWQIDGYTNNGDAVVDGGTLYKDTDSEIMFKQSTNAGYQVYTMMLPVTVQKGDYTIVVTATDNNGQTYTFSGKVWGA